MKRERGIVFVDANGQSMRVDARLYETLHHPAIVAPDGLCANIEIHPDAGFEVVISRYEKGSMYLSIRRAPSQVSLVPADRRVLAEEGS